MAFVGWPAAGPGPRTGQLDPQARQQIIEAFVGARQILSETALCHDAGLYAYGASDSTPTGAPVVTMRNKIEFRDGDPKVKLFS